MANVKKIILEIDKFSNLDFDQNLQLNYHGLWGDELVEILKHCFDKKYFINVDLEEKMLISTVKIYFQNKEYFHVNHVNLFAYGGYNNEDEFDNHITRLEQNLEILKSLEPEFRRFFENTKIEYKNLYKFCEQKSKNPDLQFQVIEKQIKT